MIDAEYLSRKYGWVPGDVELLDGDASGPNDIGDDEEPEPGEATRAALDGDQLQAYWTRGKGLARWSTNPHPWTRLLGLLRKHPGIRDPEGLASHYFKAVFGIWPGERKGSNAAGPG